MRALVGSAGGSHPQGGRGSEERREAHWIEIELGESFCELRYL